MNLMPRFQNLRLLGVGFLVLLTYLCWDSVGSAFGYVLDGPFAPDVPLTSRAVTMVLSQDRTLLALAMEYTKP
jgi:hypothetical protein